jgi:hypothetical protein
VLNDVVEIQKQNALEEAEERDPVVQKRTEAVSKLNERLELAADDIKVFEDIYLHIQRAAATTRQGTVRILAYYEEILTEKRYLPRQTSAFDLFESSSETRASPSVLLHTGDER